MMNEFNEAMFKTKVDNMFVKVMTAIMKGDLSEVRHFLNDDLESYYEKKINDLDSRNVRQMYDELNVKNTRIIARDILDDKEVVRVELISRYMDYLIQKDTGNLVLGDDTRRIEKVYILTLEKKNNTKNIGMVRKCPGCGASISVNTNGKCEYCDTIFNQEDYDYVLTKIESNL